MAQEANWRPAKNTFAGHRGAEVGRPKQKTFSHICSRFFDLLRNET